jgi:hypothetical protein
MFTSKTPREVTRLEETIDRLHSDMQTVDPDTDKYAAMADNLTKLYKLREHDIAPSWKPSPDVVLTVFANLAGIAMIVGHERAHVVTSKAISFVGKLK